MSFTSRIHPRNLKNLVTGSWIKKLHRKGNAKQPQQTVQSQLPEESMLPKLPLQPKQTTNLELPPAEQHDHEQSMQLRAPIVKETLQHERSMKPGAPSVKEPLQHERSMQLRAPAAEKPEHPLKLKSPTAVWKKPLKQMSKEEVQEWSQLMNRMKTYLNDMPTSEEDEWLQLQNRMNKLGKEAEGIKLPTSEKHK